MFKVNRFEFLLAFKGKMLGNINQAPTTIDISIFSNGLVESIQSYQIIWNSFVQFAFIYDNIVEV